MKLLIPYFTPQTYSTDRSEATTNVSVSTKVPHLGTLYSLPKEAPIETLPWWKTSIFYQVYPRSFKDTTNSGTGDLVGITEKADYLKELGIGAVWISPFYVSPMADFGYDIADYRNVDPIFGTMDDFNQLLKEFHKRGMSIRPIKFRLYYYTNSSRHKSMSYRYMHQKLFHLSINRTIVPQRVFYCS